MFSNSKAVLPVSQAISDYHHRFGKALHPFHPRRPTELCWNMVWMCSNSSVRAYQGVVYLAKREGVDGYHTNVALKMFYRHPSWNADEYVGEMQRVAQQALLVSQIQHDNLIAIQNFVAMDETRVLVMEWVDGLDVAGLLDLKLLERLHQAMAQKTWERLNDVIVTSGEDHCRLKPGIAVDVPAAAWPGSRRCTMTGLSTAISNPPISWSNALARRRLWTLTVRVLSDGQAHIRGTQPITAHGTVRGMPIRLASDVAALGYILIEMLTGRQLVRVPKRWNNCWKQSCPYPKGSRRFFPPKCEGTGFCTHS